MDMTTYDILSNSMLAMINGYIFFVLVYRILYNDRRFKSRRLGLVLYLFIFAIEIARRFALKNHLTSIPFVTTLEPLFIAFQLLLLRVCFNLSSLKALAMALYNQIVFIISFFVVNAGMYRLYSISLSDGFPFFARQMHEMTLMALVVLVHYLIIVLTTIIWRGHQHPPLAAKVIVGMLMPTVLFIVGYIAVYPYMSYIDNHYTALLAGTLLFIVNIFAWFTCIGLDKKNVSLYYTKQSYWKQRDYFTEISEEYRYVMKRVHDERKHYNHMLGLVQHNQYDRLTDYIQSLSSTLVDIGNYTVTGNQDMDMVLSAKIAEADKMGCSLSVVGILPENIEIDPVDSCILLGNCVDNAINACMDTDNHEILIEFNVYRSFIIIKIQNECKEPFGTNSFINNNRFTNKPTGGLGLDIIETVANKYDGMVEIECDNGVFAIEILLRNFSQ